MPFRLFVVLFAAAIALPGGWPAPYTGGSLSAGGHIAARSQLTAPRPAPAAVASKHYASGSIASLHLARAGGGKQPVFRGGTRIPTRAVQSSTATPSRPLIPTNPPALYNSLNAAGLTPAGANVTPPDSTGAIGPSNYVEMTNTGVAIYDRTLALLSSVDLDTFAGAPGGTPLCDVQIQWDEAAGRWLYSVLICDTTTSSQGVGVGWSETSDPLGAWCNGNGVATTPFLMDFDKLGHSTNFLVVGGNFYDESNPTPNPPFAGAAMFWVQLPANGDTSCNFPTSVNGTSTPLSNGDNTLAYTPVPVNTTSSASDVWTIAAYDPAGNTGASVGSRSKLAAWDLDSSGVLHQRADVAVTSYSVPSPASQSVTGDTIDTLDGRLTQAVGNPTTGIYTQHTVLDGAGRSQVNWIELAASGANLVLVQQGVIDNSPSWTFNAAISPRFDGQGAAIFYDVSDSSVHPYVQAQVRRPTTPGNTFEPGRLTLVTSTAQDVDFSCNNPTLGIPCRWGDYSGATPDPVNTSVVWGTNMFISAATSMPPGWSDENFAVLVAVRQPAPTGVTARSDGRGDAAINWTPSAFDAGTPTTGYTIRSYAGGVTPGPQVTIGGNASGGQLMGLTSGVSYTFTVTAVNLVGASPESSPSSLVLIGGISPASSASPQPRGGVNPEPSASPQPR